MWVRRARIIVYRFDAGVTRDKTHLTFMIHFTINSLNQLLFFFIPN